MGRTLLRAVIEGEGLVLAGALEHSASSHLGEDAGVLAGLPPTGITVQSDIGSTLTGVDVVIDFSSTASSVRLAERLAGQGIAMSSAPPAFPMKTSPPSRRPPARRWW